MTIELMVMNAKELKRLVIGAKVCDNSEIAVDSSGCWHVTNGPYAFQEQPCFTGYQLQIARTKGYLESL